MSGILSGPINAFFDYLGTKSAYTDLGLKEFRRVDGQVLDIERDEIAESWLPLISVDRVGFETDDSFQPGGETNVEVEADLTILYRAEGSFGAQAVTGCEAAIEAIYDTINARLAKQTHFGAPALIDSARLTIDQLHPVFEAGEDGEGVPVFWRAAMSLVLRKRRQS